MSRKRRAKTRRKKKGIGLIIFLSLLIVCCLFVLTGLVRGTLGEQISGLLPKAVTDKVTEKVTQSVMEKAVEKALESSGDTNASAKAKEIIRNMDEEDKQKAEEIIGKYADGDTISDCLEIVGDGVNQDSIAQVEEYLQGNVSEEDRAQLEELYRKYGASQ